MPGLFLPAKDVEELLDACRRAVNEARAAAERPGDFSYGREYNALHARYLHLISESNRLLPDSGKDFREGPVLSYWNPYLDLKSRRFHMLGLAIALDRLRGHVWIHGGVERSAEPLIVTAHR